jgi:hypothetical protein
MDDGWHDKRQQRSGGDDADGDQQFCPPRDPPPSMPPSSRIAAREHAPAPVAHQTSATFARHVGRGRMSGL